MLANTHYLIFAMAIVQSFMAGWYLCEKLTWTKDLFDKITAIGKAVIILMFGLPLLVIGIPAIALIFGVQRLSDYFHLTFIIKYIILRKKFDPDTELINKLIARMEQNTAAWYNIRWRLYVYCLNWAKTQIKTNP